MIEWIVLGLIGLGALGGSQNKTSTSPQRPRNIGGKSVSKIQHVSETERQQKIKAWRAQWQGLIDRSAWIPICSVDHIFTKFPAPQFDLNSLTPSDPIRNQLAAEFEAHNREFTARQKLRLQNFFKTIEKNALTDEQIEACVCMDARVQIVAAAGSGKTSTMVAKAGYALHEHLARGEQILMLAFNSDAAKELDERTRERLANIPSADKITAKTFHSFGLYIIGQSTGKKPSLAPWVENAGEDTKMIVKIIDEICLQDESFKNDWHMFRTIYGSDVGQFDAPDEPDAYANGKRGFRTANGEIVKSKEERFIANWLFYHNINYEYERPYEHETATATHRQYCPDFFYPDANLYHEHFALNASGRAPKHFERSYVEGVIWKRKLHDKMGTPFFETTSAQISSGVALQLLENELRKRKITVKFDPNRKAPGSRPILPEQLARTIRVFQQHVKSNGLSHEDLEKALKKHSRNGHADRLSRFVKIYQRVDDAWDKKLKEGGYIDFEDMLLLAAEHVESGRFNNPYKFILSDEFQDSSRARIRLLKALAGPREEGRHLCVVGDDWQGINRFAGADISVMMEFERIFNGATRLSLTKSFRSPQAICDIASGFIQANPAQIRKNVVSENHYKTKQYLFIYGFENPLIANEHLLEQLCQMERYLKAGKLDPGKNGKLSVLLLGRYRNDRPASLDQWQDRFGESIDLEFKTVHSSKGLEADYIMLLNVIEGNRGFPSQIEDDPILQIPMPAPDTFPMAEERRLFYVAMTRARRQLRIYTSLERPSRFLIELVKNNALVIEPIDASPLDTCPKCNVGVLTKRAGQFGSFQSCSTWPRCDFKRNLRDDANANRSTIRFGGVVQGHLCPNCGVGKMIKIQGRYGEFLGCSKFPSCKATAKIISG